MAKEENKCKNKAEIAVPWAGKILKCCEKHANALVMIGNAMGSSIQARRLPPNKDKCEMNDDLD